MKTTAANNRNEKVAGVIFLVMVAVLILLSGSVSAQNINRSNGKAVVSEKDSEAVISWSYAPESKYNFFLIERSTDNTHYEFVSAISIKGNSNSTNFYSATDHNPLNGATYYRVSETDFKGKPVHLFVLKYSSSVSLTQN